ncbi:MAG TPA: hypothetical protein VGM27_15610 [Acidobacteriaceae bacterium]
MKCQIALWDKHDARIAALSLDLIPREDRRWTRALLQFSLASDVHKAIHLCLREDLTMPLAALLRSLIDTSVLGIWLVKYADDKEAQESVEDKKTLEIEQIFNTEDRQVFAFLYEPVKDTENQFYRDVLHPSVHGDAFHLAMRTRNEAAKRAWSMKCQNGADQIYKHFLIRLRESAIVPSDFQKKLQLELNQMHS